ncbi:MAG: hypothetical protein LAT67_10300 [Balneolales bacterium]|nr:hypothetical protein [Balneolales bacterium]
MSIGLLVVGGEWRQTSDERVEANSGVDMFPNEQRFISIKNCNLETFFANSEYIKFAFILRMVPEWSGQAGGGWGGRERDVKIRWTFTKALFRCGS